jgi:hypothetical protein
MEDHHIGREEAQKAQKQKAPFASLAHFRD